MIALKVQRFAAGANVICLTYATDWWAVIGPVIHGESKSQATRSSSDHVGLLHTLSTVNTQESKLGVRLVLEVLAKLMVGENSSWECPKVGVRFKLEVRLILETRRYINTREPWVPRLLHGPDCFMVSILRMYLYPDCFTAPTVSQSQHVVLILI